MEDIEQIKSIAISVLSLMGLLAFGWVVFDAFIRVITPNSGVSESEAQWRGGIAFVATGFALFLISRFLDNVQAQQRVATALESIQKQLASRQ